MPDIYDYANEKYGFVDGIFYRLSAISGVPEDFLIQIKTDSDWLFLIKWHAILEVCVNHMLGKHFDRPESLGAFARLEMSNQRTGKMLFVSACNLLPKEMRTFIHRLSEMRNHAVHDIKNFDFSFPAYIAAIAEKDRNAWLNQIGFVFPERHPEDIGLKRTFYVNHDPRFVVHVGCHVIAGTALRYIESTDAMQQVIKGLRDQKLIEPGESTPKE